MADYIGSAATSAATYAYQNPLQTLGIVAAVGATIFAPENAAALPEEIAGIEGTAAAEGILESGAASSLQGFRLSQQLAAEQAAGATAPTGITSYSTHVLEQIAGRDAGIGVSQSALEDAFANPNAIQYAPSSYGPTFRYVGNDATVVLNPQGNAVTGWATSVAGIGR